MHCGLGLSWPVEVIQPVREHTTVILPDLVLQVLTGTRHPLVVFRDMYLSRTMAIAQVLSWHDRDGIFLVVDVRHV